jgi:invasion protein IalB
MDHQMNYDYKKTVLGLRHYLSIGIWLLTSGLFGEANAAEPLQAPAPKAPDQSSDVYGDWTVRCVAREGVPPCEMAQIAANNTTHEQVMRISIAHAGQSESLGVQIQVPLGVLLTGGVLVRVDDKQTVGNFQFTRCEANGCLIEGVVTPETLAPFRKASKGILAVLDRQGKPLVLPLSFEGYEAAMDAMSSKNIRWAKTLKK